MLNESLVKYLSGLLDADGSMSFTFRRQRDEHEADLYYMGLSLRLASSAAIDHHGFVFTLPEMTGMGSISKYGANQQFHTWMVHKRSDLEMLVPRLVKHMVIKAKHFQWQMDMWRENSGKLLTPAQCEELKEASKASRVTRSGPLKPKNHPTWAWLAGYLDGDGWYKYKRYSSRGYQSWHVSIGAVAHANDAAVLHFLTRTLGGIVRAHGQSPNVFVWHRNMGDEQRSYALRTLPYLAKHSRLKRHKIDQIIHHHQQRLSAPTPAGEATV